jgi:hypothetical protein
MGEERNEVLMENSGLFIIVQIGTEQNPLL